MFNMFFDTAQDRDIPFPRIWEASWPCWDWAEPSDRLENTVACNLAAIQRDAVQRSAAIMDNNLKFLHRRLHADVDCAEDLLATTDPAAFYEIATSFWQRLFEDYGEQAEAMAAILQQPVDLSNGAGDVESPMTAGGKAGADKGSAEDRSIIAINRQVPAKSAKAA